MRFPEITLREAQVLQQQWEQSILPETTVRDRLGRYKEEADELLAHLTPELEAKLGDKTYREQIGGEVADTIIIALSIVENLGLDVQTIFTNKLDRNYRKYNPVENKRLRAEGLGQDEAMALQKQRWNR